MKRLILLFTVIMFFGISACSNGEIQNTNDKTNVMVCQEGCQKACCLGCKATEGAKKCIFLSDGSMPCCLPE